MIGSCGFAIFVVMTVIVLTNSFVLDRESIEFHKPFQLDYKTYKKWPYLTITEKLPYLVDRIYLITTTNDFDKFNGGVDISLESLTAVLEEYQDLKVIQRFFKECDTDQNNLISWDEYIVCRGYFDLHGVPHDATEFDVLENVVLNDFVARLNDPTDPMVLELIANNEL